MTTGQTRGGLDTYVEDARASKNFSGVSTFWTQGGGGATPQRIGLLKMKSPVPAGATVISATLTLRQGAAVPSSKTVHLYKLTEDTNFGNVTWATKPAHTTTGGVTATGGTVDGALWTFDVTDYVQQIANGAPNYGWKITCDNTNGLAFGSSENASVSYQPLLTVNYSTAPSAPTRLKPSASYVATGKPVVSCDYTDRSGSTQLQSIQVQIDPTNDWTGADLWDSGEVPVNQPALDLNTSPVGHLYPGLAPGAVTWWRVRVKDADNNWSGWSASTWFGNAAQGTLAITAPAAGANVTEFTPPVTWTFTAPQTHFQVQVTSTDGQILYHDSGKIQSPTLGYTIPKRVLTDNRDYLLTVFVWDNIVREAVQGSPSYVSATRTFHVAFDPSVPPPASLSSSQPTIAPFVLLDWSRSTVPNSFTIVRDDGNGEFALDTDIDPADLAVVGTPGAYRYTDYTVLPSSPHTYRVRAEVGGKLSDVGPATTITVFPEGIWLLDPTNQEWVVLSGRDGLSFASSDNAQTYTPLGTLDPVRTVMGLAGLSGSCSGLMLRTREGIDWTVYQRRLYSMKAKPAQTFRLIMGDLNIPVILGNIVIAPDPRTKKDQILKTVSFDWWQLGEQPFQWSM